MKYQLHIPDLTGKESAQDHDQEDLDIYINALIEDLKSVDGVSIATREEHRVTMHLDQGHFPKDVHARIKSVLKNYFHHLGPLRYQILN